MKIFKIDQTTFGLVTPTTIEIWHDHAFDGSGVNNMVVPFKGKELDLEFVRTVELVTTE